MSVVAPSVTSPERNNLPASVSARIRAGESQSFSGSWSKSLDIGGNDQLQGLLKAQGQPTHYQALPVVHSPESAPPSSLHVLSRAQSRRL